MQRRLGYVFSFTMSKRKTNSEIELTPEYSWRPDFLAQRIERQRGEDGACFACGGGETVCGGFEPRGEDFGGVTLWIVGERQRRKRRALVLRRCKDIVF